MKWCMILIIFSFFSLLPNANAQIEDRMPGGNEFLYVEHGDTLLQLFGPDWEKVQKANDSIVFYDRRGKRQPDKLVSGQRLTIPSGTYLSPTGKERLDRYARMRADARRRIDTARELSKKVPANSSEAWQAATELLSQAEQAFNAEGFAFKNYLRASELAEAASTKFQSLRQQNVQLASNIVEIPPDSSKENDGTELVITIVTVVGAVIFLTFFTLGWNIRRKRLIRKEAWAEKHRKTVKRIVNQNI